MGDQKYDLMNLDHPYVEKRVIAEMEQGVDVYYDTRWEITEVLTRWLSENVDTYADKKVLILGAGVGAETLVLAKHADRIWINDLAPTALKLCGEQLDQNKLHNHTSLLGRYEELELPKVDLVVASFLVYNKETLTAMRAFMKANECEFILMNEPLAEFKQCLKTEPHQLLFQEEDAICVLLGS